MTDKDDNEGLGDLNKERAEWCQTFSDSQQPRTELQPELPYHNWAAPGHLSVPPDALAVHDGHGSKMANHADH